MLRYRCLVLDHDDTVVKSTPEIGYPSFVQTLSVLRPGTTMTYEQFLTGCFHPGFHALCQDVLGYNDEEMEYEFTQWQAYVMAHTPSLWEGMERIIRRQKAEGGLVCVASHSCTQNITRDYLAHVGVAPDLIFGWELEPDQRKPHPYPLRTVMERYSLRPEELLMVDDLKPGLDMARSCGVPFACAGWSCPLPEIQGYMRREADFYLSSVDELETLAFAGE